METKDALNGAMRSLSALLRIRANKFAADIELNNENPLEEVFQRHSEGLDDILYMLKKVSLELDCPETKEPWKTLKNEEVNTWAKDCKFDLELEMKEICDVKN